MKDTIYKYTLKNAADFGKANPKAVMGKILGERPEFRSRAKEIIPLIDEMVAKVNAMSAEEVQAQVSKFDFVQKAEKKKDYLPELKNAGNVKMRFAPNPSGPLHLGHCRAAILNDEYVKRYGGKLVLRLEDTDPNRVDPDAYDMIEEDLKWLGVKVDEKIIQSERLSIYHERCRELIEQGHAYVCTCEGEEFQKLRNKKETCPCRENDMEKNEDRFSRMFSDYKEGEAVVRLKTDMDIPDPAMRDFPIMRISETPHPRVKENQVYPLMNFSVPVDDHLLGITHVLRGKDHIANTRKQDFIYNYFDWPIPEYIHYGRLKIEDVALSTSAISKGIKEGTYSGWNDVGLGTIRALARRGFQPEAIRKAMLDVGVKGSDISFSWKNLNAFNKDIIEEAADRYFFVGNPRLMVIEGAPLLEGHAPLHPQHLERGKRNISIIPEGNTSEVLISTDDAKKLKNGSFIRLMEAFNIEIIRIMEEKILAKYHSIELEVAREKKAQLIHWVPHGGIPTKVVAPEGEIIGMAEKDFEFVEVGDIIQFERFGFVKVDKKNQATVVVYAHK